MNEDSQFTIHGDEPVEARIVSWVLGEASAFEAAELERLCGERPELLVFRRRMRALHGLLTEAEATEADESWKLPPEKRRILDEIFGEEKPVCLEVEKEKRIRRSGRRAFFAIAACVVITLVVLRMTPWKHTSEAIIEVRPRGSGMSPIGDSLSGSNESSMTPQFFGSEFEKIKGRRSLEKVVDNLDLTDRWGVDKEQALKIVKESVKTKNVRGTDLIEIDVRHNNKQDADDIAREVAHSYKSYRAETEGREAERQLQALNKAVRDQEDKVEERRKVLSTIARTKGVIYRGDDSFSNNSNVDELREEAIKRGLDAQDYTDAKRDFEADQELLQKMKLKLMGDTIAGRVPAESVVIHDSPPAKHAARTPLAKLSRLWKDSPFTSKGVPASASAPAAEVSDRSYREQIVKEGDELKPSVDLERDGDFGDGWGENEKNGKLDRDSQVAANEPKPMPAPASAPIPSESINIEAGGVVNGKWSSGSQDGYGSGSGGGGSAGKPPQIAVMREFKYPTEYEAPELPNAVSALAEKPEGQAFPVTPATPTSFESKNSGALIDGRKENLPVVRGRIVDHRLSDSDDLGQDASESAESPAPPPTTLGLRSGDHAISPKNIDAILNNPNRVDEAKFTQSNPESGEKKQAADKKAPVLGNIPVDGAFFGRVSESSEGPGIPWATTPSGYTDGPARTNPALTHEHAKNVDEVHRNLYTAEGNFNLGKYDEAQKAYEETLRIDPYNSAARRGLERVESTKSDYYRAAHDNTRAELLTQVDDAWELEVPVESAEKDAANMDPFWDTSKTLASGKPAGGVEYEIHSEHKSEYLFRGMDLGKDKTKPAPVPLVDLMEEIPASEAPYSTFSLNISDASFQIAQAALAKGEQPDPAGIKVEQFYNAVDYGDPAPSAGEPVAVSIEQSANPVIPGRNLVRVALKTAAAGRSAAQALRLTLLVDQSGSMVREDRRAAMDKALAGLGGLLTENDLVTVIGFSRTPRLLADGVTGDKAGKLADLVNQAASEGGTNLEEAIKLAGQKAMGRKLAGAQNRIVLFTDGAANLGDADPGRLAEKVKALRQQGISFDIAGIAADGLNDELLGGLARHGNGRYYVVGKGGDDDFAKQLAGAFRPAAENVKVQVRFNPERVGRYKLIGFEKDRLKTEDFRNDAVDAAELAAEEAGVAIYQVEPLPGGSGELGEVSVRFRDTGRDVMVERAWTIPYDSKAPVLDRATPSMQLAVLSMLAGEKLKGGPLADAIDFKQFTEAKAEVKHYYGNTGRVAEMLHMVDVLK